jgi:VIT1/CCC1 family predicted Fe2+/Mn2+ transporter
MDQTILQTLLQLQQNEITEHFIYKNISKLTKNRENSGILAKIADDELKHYQRWKHYTNKDVKPVRYKIWFYTVISWILGFTFAIKLMENEEEKGKDIYHLLSETIEEANQILQDESEHEIALIAMLDEERLRYAGSVILGLNDALVELTGALAGLTLALQNTRLIALTGSITGVAAALSMAASEYLSTKTEETSKTPFKASFYTGIAYLCTVLILIMPYLLFSNYFLCLGVTLMLAVIIIAAFNFYISVARDLSFSRRFWEMTLLSFSVATLSFAISYLLKRVLAVDI